MPIRPSQPSAHPHPPIPIRPSPSTHVLLAHPRRPGLPPGRDLGHTADPLAQTPTVGQAYPHGRPPVASGQGRHADDGRHPHHPPGRVHHPRPQPGQSLRSHRHRRLGAGAGVGAGQFRRQGCWTTWPSIRRRGDAQGLLARSKFPAQVALAAILALIMYFGLDLHSIALPTVPERIDIDGMWIPIAIFIITAMANAVNITDGLDGLAGSIAAVCYVAYGVIAFLQGQVWLAALCFTIVGATFAFLWFNAYPAQMFMGDIGAMALGATLAVVALMTGQWLLLPIIGFPFVAETLSVIIQVLSAKLSRRFLGRDLRPFKMSPLHHHFELLGWSETHVTQRFFLIGLLSAMFGIALALL
ncbi:MAG: phospho-N-acetylmuramoyl-pentapeptide-transferase [Caldilineales bacterium]|nr:phospho-N-acetylmuramoyl-pentapeptide-transferase [Caldilineales bacterium]